MSVNLRNIFQRMAPSQQDVRTLHGVITAIAQGRKGPARGGVLDGAGAEKLRALDRRARRRRARRPSARRCAVCRGCCGAIRPTPSAPCGRRWSTTGALPAAASSGRCRSARILPTSSRSRAACVIDLVPAGESEAAAARARRAARWLEAHDYRVIEVKAGEVEARRGQSSRRSRRAQPFSAFMCAADALAEKAEIAADGEIAEAALGHRRRALGGRAIKPGDLAGLFRRGDDLVELAPRPLSNADRARRRRSW